MQPPSTSAATHCCFSTQYLTERFARPTHHIGGHRRHTPEHCRTCLLPPPFSATWHCEHLVLKIFAPAATTPSGASAYVAMLRVQAAADDATSQDFAEYPARRNTGQVSCAAALSGPLAGARVMMTNVVVPCAKLLVCHDCFFSITDTGQLHGQRVMASPSPVGASSSSCKRLRRVLGAQDWGLD